MLCANNQYERSVRRKLKEKVNGGNRPCHYGRRMALEQDMDSPQYTPQHNNIDGDKEDTPCPTGHRRSGADNSLEGIRLGDRLRGRSSCESFLVRMEKQLIEVTSNFEIGKACRVDGSQPDGSVFLVVRRWVPR